MSFSAFRNAFWDFSDWFKDLFVDFWQSIFEDDFLLYMFFVPIILTGIGFILFKFYDLIEFNTGENIPKFDKFVYKNSKMYVPEYKNVKNKYAIDYSKIDSKPNYLNDYRNFKRVQNDMGKSLFNARTLNIHMRYKWKYNIKPFFKSEKG